jgi:glucose-1-phosphate thymidylyltransferase
MNIKGVVLHGGAGTRLRPLTHTGPKQLIPIANKPTSQYVLEDLREAGIRDIAIVVGDIYPEKVKEYYGDGSGLDLEITYIDQDKPKGIAHAIALCERFVDSDRFVVYLGDNLLKGGIGKYLNEFLSKSYDAMVLLTKVKDPSKFGVARLDQNGRLVGLVEKPKIPPSNYALVGLYFLSPIVFDSIRGLKPSWREELEITEALQAMLSSGRNVGYEVVEGWWKDTGTPEDILDANRLVLDELEPNLRGEVEEDSSIQGRVYVDEEAVIRKGSLVRGPCIVGKRSEVGFGVYVGPYTSIGDDVSIRRGEVENSIIMDHCLIDIEDRIVDSIIGPYSQITSSRKNRPKGRKLILGERSQLSL